jgi:hypothetical protein
LNIDIHNLALLPAVYGQYLSACLHSAAPTF